VIKLKKTPELLIKVSCTWSARGTASGTVLGPVKPSEPNQRKLWHTADRSRKYALQEFLLAFLDIITEVDDLGASQSCWLGLVTPARKLLWRSARHTTSC
jgi:hypothetical protein